jgi:hypothetical protein
MASEAKSSGHSSAATGGSNWTIHNGLSKGQSFIVVLLSSLSIGLAIGAVVVGAVSARESDRANAEVRALSERAEREARMLQYYVLEMDAKLIAAGFKTDEESVAKRLKENEQ